VAPDGFTTIERQTNRSLSDYAKTAIQVVGRVLLASKGGVGIYAITRSVGGRYLHKRTKTPPLPPRPKNQFPSMADQPAAEHVRAVLATRNWPQSVLLAVSGGADSVALLRGMAELPDSIRPKLVVAHLNHQLRPEAAADQQFVIDLASELALPCFCQTADIRGMADAAGDGIEAAARTARYAFFESVAGKVGASQVLTAHTADDQAETVLHRIIRGTGIEGLQGMPESRPLTAGVELVRPLLSIRRSTLREYLAELGQTFREDSSNAEMHYARNRIRNELLPLLEQNYNQSVVESLLRLRDLSAGVQSLVRENVQRLLAVTPFEFTEGAQRITVDLTRLAKINFHLLRELLREVWRQAGWPQQGMGLREWDKLANLAASLPGSEPAMEEEAALHWPHLAGESKESFMLPGKILAERRGTRLVLSRK